MDNRKPAGDCPQPSNDFNRNKTFRADQTDQADDNRTFGARKFPPSENRFLPERRAIQNPNEKFQTRGGATGNAPNRIGKPQPSNENPPPRPADFQRRDTKSTADEQRGRFQSRESKYRPRADKFSPKNRFASTDKNFKSRERKQQREMPAPPLPRIVSDAQVTDGKHRGKYLQTGASPKFRRTERRLREVMFRILYRRIRAGRFLDLCAGTGMVGIEAISRGAMLGTFVERLARLCSTIKKNLDACGIKNGHGEVVEMEVAPFLKRMEKRRRQWDAVYFDPPLDADYDEVLDFFARGATLRTGGVLIVEHHAEMFFPETFGAMRRWRVLVQGETALSFYERR